MKCLICDCQVDTLKNEIHTNLYQCIAALAKRIKKLEGGDRRPSHDSNAG